MFNFFKKPSEETLSIYLRSGQTIVIDRVIDWAFVRGERFELTVNTKAKNKLIVKTLSPSDIVAVVRS